MFYQSILDRCNAKPTDEMSYEEWLELRKSSIGGSDSGAILGYIGEWGSSATVFGQKKGKDKPNKEMSPAAMRGKILEPVIRKYFAAEYPGLVIENVPYILYHPEFSFISANIDGIIHADKPIVMNGKQLLGIGGLEIKTSGYGYGYGKDEIPDGYYCQVQHYMAVTGLQWFVLAVYFLEKEEVRYFVVERNNDFINNDLIPPEIEFWEKYYIPNEWPPFMGIEAEDEMITGMIDGGSTIVFGDDIKELCRLHEDAKNREKAAEAEKKLHSIEIKAAIAEEQKKQSRKTDEKKVIALAGPYTITFSIIERKDVDRDALKKDGLFERYQKTISYDQLRVNQKKARKWGCPRSNAWTTFF